jgi:hypothetical protein
MRHSPAAHTSTCHCGDPATKHVAYGSGCGNVCATCAAAIKRVKGAMYSGGELVLLPDSHHDHATQETGRTS